MPRARTLVTMTLSVTPEVKAKIRSLGRFGESTDDVLRRLLGIPPLVGRTGGIGLKIRKKWMPR